MQNDLNCENCGMIFDSPQALSTHQLKFCISSNYADLDSLARQHDTLQPNASPLKQTQKRPLASSSHPLAPSVAGTNSLEREYQELLRQIGDREDLRKRLQRQKMSAEEQLSLLEKKQKQAFFGAKRKELQDVIKRREDLTGEEELLQKQIKAFEKDRKEESRVQKLQGDQDYAYREGREAGKLAMQRRLLEQKKRQIQGNLKAKRRQQQRINREIDSINDNPIFIPEYRKKDTQIRKTKPEHRQATQPSDYAYPVALDATSKLAKTNQSRVATNAQKNIKPIPPVNSLQKSTNSAPSLSEQYLKPALFAGKQKTLFESLNPKGKSDQDIFIESLLAQEYDALNILARLPKDSELYSAKLRQFQEMSKMRQELKDKIQKVRLDKVRKEFQHQKSMTETEKNNLQWLDKNRKNMLNRQVQMLQQQARQQQLQQQNQLLQAQMSKLPQHLRNKNSTHYLNNINSTHAPQMPSIEQIYSKGRLPTSHEGARGYKIAVKGVRGYSSKGPMCVRAAVIEDVLSGGGQWIFNTKYHDQAAPKDDRNPYNPSIRNRIDQSGVIVFNQTFQIRQDLQARYNRNQFQLYLWLMIMQKDDIKISNQPDLYVWYCFKLTHFGHVRDGAFTLAMYHDQFPFPQAPDMNRMKGKGREEVSIQVGEYILSQEKKEMLIRESQEDNKDNRQRTIVNKTRQKQSDRESDSRVSTPPPQQTLSNLKTMTIHHSDPKINTVKDVHQEFFIQNEQPSEFQQIKQSDKVSFDFTISALRTLPSYTGPVKIQIKFIDCQDDELFETQQGLAQFGNDMYNPQVKIIKQIQKQQIPSSTVVLIRLISISTLTYEPGLLGFAYFHICFDQQGNPLQKNKSNFFLINGHYQLPIYWGNIDNYITLGQLNSKYPTIPCSSILVSLNTYDKKGNKSLAKIPQYSSGKFNTVFFQVTQMEYRLFQQQAKREHLQTMQYVKGYYKFKGVSISANKEPELRKLLTKALAFNVENLSNLHLLAALAEYSSVFGVAISIDSMRIPSNQSNYYYFCTACLYPPGDYYRDNRAQHLDFLYKLDLGSSLTASLTLNHPPLSYNPSYDPKASLIVQMHRIQLSNGLPDSSVQTCGFTVIPLFDISQEVACVNVGYRHLSLIQGDFDKRQLASLESNSVRYIQLLEGQKKSQFGIVARVLNGYFEKQLGPGASNGQGKPLRSIFQNSKGFKSAEQKAKKIIEDTFGADLS